MISNRNIRKAFFNIETKIILIIIVVASINLFINSIPTILFNNYNEFSFSILEQFSHYIALFAFIYLIAYGVSLSTTIVPFFISLNCPKKALGKNIVLVSITRCLIVTIIIFLVNHLIKIDNASRLLFNSIFGIHVSSLSLIESTLLFAITFLFAQITFNFFVYLGLAGQKHGWQIVLASILTLIGICFYLHKQIFLFFCFGTNLVMTLIILIILNIFALLINYINIKNFEYKL